MSAAEFDELVRYEKLFTLAEERLGSRVTISKMMSPYIMIIRPVKQTSKSDDFFSVSSINNEINVYNSNNLELAVELAKRYEESGESEFTVRKRYDSSS